MQDDVSSGDARVHCNVKVGTKLTFCVIVQTLPLTVYFFPIPDYAGKIHTKAPLDEVRACFIRRIMHAEGTQGLIPRNIRLFNNKNIRGMEHWIHTILSYGNAQPWSNQRENLQDKYRPSRSC